MSDIHDAEAQDLADLIGQAVTDHVAKHGARQGPIGAAVINALQRTPYALVARIGADERDPTTWTCTPDIQITADTETTFGITTPIVRIGDTEMDAMTTTEVIGALVSALEDATAAADAANHAAQEQTDTTTVQEGHPMFGKKNKIDVPAKPDDDTQIAKTNYEGEIISAARRIKAKGGPENADEQRALDETAALRAEHQRKHGK